MQELPPSQLKAAIEPEFDMESEIIRQNHLEADVLIKRGVKVRKPHWVGMIAS